MGFRTVVILYNDQCSEWENDPTLGKKIAHGMNDAMNYNISNSRTSNAYLGYGKVVQCMHADTQTLAIIDGYQFTPIGHGFQHHDGESSENLMFKLFKSAAEHYGYKLIKDSKGKK
jgi:hypothetical protein